MSNTDTVQDIPPDQSALIKGLEQRLNDLEARLAQMGESQGRPEVEGNVDRHGKNAGDDDETKKTDRPPIPPIVPTVHRVSMLGYFGYRLPSESLHAIMVGVLPSESDKAELEAFRSSVADQNAPETAWEMLEKADSLKVVGDVAVGYEIFRVNSVPLSRLLLILLCGQSNPEGQLLEFERPFVTPVYYHGEVTPLKCYVDFMEREIIPFFNSFDQRNAASNFKVYFRDLWYLFKPGETIYFQGATSRPSESDYQRLHRSNRPDQRLWRIYTRYEKGGDFWVKAYCIDHDGERFVCVKEWFRIETYNNSVSVDSLKVFPVRFHADHKTIMADATATGQRFQEFLNVRLAAHNGWALEPGNKSPSIRSVTSDVVIDSAETFRIHTNLKPSSGLPATSYLGDRGEIDEEEQGVSFLWLDKRGDLQSEDIPVGAWREKQIARKEKKEYCHSKDPLLASWMNSESGPLPIREEDYHLLPSRMFAYSLQDRMFLVVDVLNLERIKPSNEAFQSLVIDKNHKRMLLALVKSHFIRKRNLPPGVHITSQDIVHNKGRGLVILLHGVPGVEKTSTAETIATYFRKPLLPITCGDLGLDPAEVEGSLKQMFRLAQQWDCILLLDEANVFLTERQPQDLKRNALVSVFLRVLDYYSGVLLLTTNRGGTIDEAFKSRIHLSLYYPHLGRDQTIKIWRMNLNRLETAESEQSQANTKHVKLKVDRDSIERFAEKHYNMNKRGEGRWNGRQIRNAFLIASALARCENRQLSDRQFEEVVEISDGFEKYLLLTKDMADGEELYHKKARDDSLTLQHLKKDDQPSPAKSQNHHYSHTPNTSFYRTHLPDCLTGNHASQDRIPYLQLSPHSERGRHLREPSHFPNRSSRSSRSQDPVPNSMAVFGSNDLYQAEQSKYGLSDEDAY
ncbi:hypothetical protein BDV38DRAFT_276780 [Aspergillus pseudotamarii]|uniref:AAA+ ATPase domain-containing protein n=1 Tax=Aspergillus pseudotamarii TaxID=132259 RepID=A0A5N6TBD8_ASPPS|nr:uncharacterized protein BDV38DRAFT_276780 [Aspergillus pseudotamarii]KAE8143698.1 hypothetical protein BDV38DRAFT_276780 [Aspergillus pseudotamarii]